MSGDVVWMPGGVRTEIHLDAERTGGVMCLLLDAPPAGWSLPAHRHLGESETIHVIEGQFAMEIAGERSVLRPGETIHVPAGVVHGGGNVGSQAGRRLVLFHPAGVGPVLGSGSGRFFVEENVALYPQGVGAPYALALSARSDVLQQFAGAPGQIALHGIDNVGGVPGTAASHGCMRLSTPDISWLAHRIGPGTPVTITN